VRGLDYYNGVVFEITAGGLGAQNAVAGGGRYDNLYQDLGGAKTPCTGFSIGFERLLTALQAQDEKIFDELKTRRVYLAPLEDNAAIATVIRDAALALRERGFRIETSPGVFSLSQHLKKADKVSARYALIAGAAELAKGVLIVKDLAKREQSEVAFDQVSAFFK
jgi:histidyl-tRNA synthetase